MYHSNLLAVRVGVIIIFARKIEDTGKMNDLMRRSIWLNMNGQYRGAEGHIHQVSRHEWQISHKVSYTSESRCLSEKQSQM